MCVRDEGEEEVQAAELAARPWLLDHVGFLHAVYLGKAGGERFASAASQGTACCLLIDCLFFFYTST